MKTTVVISLVTILILGCALAASLSVLFSSSQSNINEALRMLAQQTIQQTKRQIESTFYRATTGVMATSNATARIGNPFLTPAANGKQARAFNEWMVTLWGSIMRLPSYSGVDVRWGDDSSNFIALHDDSSLKAQLCQSKYRVFPPGVEIDLLENCSTMVLVGTPPDLPLAANHPLVTEIFATDNRSSYLGLVWNFTYGTLKPIVGSSAVPPLGSWIPLVTFFSTMQLTTRGLERIEGFTTQFTTMSFDAVTHNPIAMMNGRILFFGFNTILLSYLQGGAKSRAFLIDGQNNVMAVSHGTTNVVYTLAQTGGVVYQHCYVFDDRMGCLYNISDHPPYELPKLSLEQANTFVTVEGVPNTKFTPSLQDSKGDEYVAFRSHLENDFIRFSFDVHVFIPSDFFLSSVREALKITIAVVVVVCVVGTLLTYFLLNLTTRSLQSLAERMEDPFHAPLEEEARACPCFCVWLEDGDDESDYTALLRKDQLSNKTTTVAGESKGSTNSNSEDDEKDKMNRSSAAQSAAASSNGTAKEQKRTPVHDGNQNKNKKSNNVSGNGGDANNNNGGTKVNKHLENKKILEGIKKRKSNNNNDNQLIQNESKTPKLKSISTLGEHNNTKNKQNAGAGESAGSSGDESGATQRRRRGGGTSHNHNNRTNSDSNDKHSIFNFFGLFIFGWSKIWQPREIASMENSFSELRSIVNDLRGFVSSLGIPLDQQQQQGMENKNIHHSKRKNKKDNTNNNDPSRLAGSMRETDNDDNKNMNDENSNENSNNRYIQISPGEGTDNNNFYYASDPDEQRQNSNNSNQQNVVNGEAAGDGNTSIIHVENIQNSSCGSHTKSTQSLKNDSSSNFPFVMPNTKDPAPNRTNVVVQASDGLLHAILTSANADSNALTPTNNNDLRTLSGLPKNVQGISNSGGLGGGGASSLHSPFSRGAGGVGAVDGSLPHNTSNVCNGMMTSEMILQQSQQQQLAVGNANINVNTSNEKGSISNQQQEDSSLSSSSSKRQHGTNNQNPNNVKKSTSPTSAAAPSSSSQLPPYQQPPGVKSALKRKSLFDLNNNNNNISTGGVSDLQQQNSKDNYHNANVGSPGVDGSNQRVSAQFMLVSGNNKNSNNNHNNNAGTPTSTNNNNNNASPFHLAIMGDSNQNIHAHSLSQRPSALSQNKHLHSTKETTRAALQGNARGQNEDEEEDDEEQEEDGKTLVHPGLLLHGSILAREAPPLSASSPHAHHFAEATGGSNSTQQVKSDDDSNYPNNNIGNNNNSNEKTPVGSAMPRTNSHAANPKVRFAAELVTNNKKDEDDDDDENGSDAPANKNDSNSKTNKKKITGSMGNEQHPNALPGCGTGDTVLSSSTGATSTTSGGQGDESREISGQTNNELALGDAGDRNQLHHVGGVLGLSGSSGATYDSLGAVSYGSRSSQDGLGEVYGGAAPSKNNNQQQQNHESSNNNNNNNNGTKMQGVSQQPLELLMLQHQSAMNGNNNNDNRFGLPPFGVQAGTGGGRGGIFHGDVGMDAEKQFMMQQQRTIANNNINHHQNNIPDTTSTVPLTQGALQRIQNTLGNNNNNTNPNRNDDGMTVSSQASDATTEASSAASVATTATSAATATTAAETNTTAGGTKIQPDKPYQLVFVAAVHIFGFNSADVQPSKKAALMQYSQLVVEEIRKLTSSIGATMTEFHGDCFLVCAQIRNIKKTKVPTKFAIGLMNASSVMQVLHNDLFPRNARRVVATAGLAFGRARVLRLTGESSLARPVSFIGPCFQEAVFVERFVRYSYRRIPGATLRCAPAIAMLPHAIGFFAPRSHIFEAAQTYRMGRMVKTITYGETVVFLPIIDRLVEAKRVKRTTLLVPADAFGNFVAPMNWDDEDFNEERFLQQMQQQHQQIRQQPINQPPLLIPVAPESTNGVPSAVPEQQQQAQQNPPPSNINRNNSPSSFHPQRQQQQHLHTNNLPPPMFQMQRNNNNIPQQLQRFPQNPGAIGNRREAMNHNNVGSGSGSGGLHHSSNNNNNSNNNIVGNRMNGNIPRGVEEFNSGTRSGGRPPLLITTTSSSSLGLQQQGIAINHNNNRHNQINVPANSISSSSLQPVPPFIIASPHASTGKPSPVHTINNNLQSSDNSSSRSGQQQQRQSGASLLPGTVSSPRDANQKNNNNNNNFGSGQGIDGASQQQQKQNRLIIGGNGGDSNEHEILQFKEQQIRIEQQQLQLQQQEIQLQMQRARLRQQQLLFQQQQQQQQQPPQQQQ